MAPVKLRITGAAPQDEAKIPSPGVPRYPRAKGASGSSGGRWKGLLALENGAADSGSVEPKSRIDLLILDHLNTSPLCL